MDNLTCVIDARTLVDNIHEIKQWVYSEHIRLYLPLCIPEQVEQLYKASSILKETQKEPQPKRSSYKPTSRKDFPLFDINPRIAREFVSRAQSETPTMGVALQLPDEQFMAWKVAEKTVEKTETTDERPTSFAQALLSKLNLASEADKSPNGLKAPPKPRLVARAASNVKPPWKINKKIPPLPIKDVPESIKPLLSCALWRLYEYEDDPLGPEVLVLLCDDPGTSEEARKLTIPTKRILDIRQTVQKHDSIKNAQNATSDLERDFPATVINQLAMTNGTARLIAPVDDHDEIDPFDMEVKIDVDGECRDSTHADASVEKVKQDSSGAVRGDLQHEASQLENHSDVNIKEKRVGADLEINGNTKQPKSSVHGLTEASKQRRDASSESLNTVVAMSTNEIAADNLHANAEPEPAVTELVTTSKPEPEEAHEEHLPEEPITTTTIIPPGSSNETPNIDVADQDKDDSDSDDEVVLFNPKAKRLSGLRNVAANMRKPGTITTLATHSHARVGGDTQPANHSNSPILVMPETQVIEKAPRPAPEQPVGRTPGVLHRQTKLNSQNSSPTRFDVKPAKTNENQAPDSMYNSAPEHLNGETDGAFNRPASQQLYNHPQASKHQRRKSKKVMAPPAIIDPDAFDRFSIPAPHANIKNDNHRLSPRGSPRRAARTPEPEIDFVLKSGSPRGSARGRGKLWIP